MHIFQVTFLGATVSLEYWTWEQFYKKRAFFTRIGKDFNGAHVGITRSPTRLLLHQSFYAIGDT